VAVEVAIIEHLRKYLFRQDVLDQHFPHVSRNNVGVDRLLRVLKELYCRLMECVIVTFRRVDHLAQRLKHRRQISFELLDRLSEIGDLRTLVANPDYA
jgi:hypothetical protein